MLLALSLLVASAAPPAHLTGDAAPDTDATFVVAIASTDAVVCSGVVIAPRAVLTTEACADDAGGVDARVLTGEQPDAGDAGVAVARVDVIPDWIDPVFPSPTILVLEADVDVDPVVVRDAKLKDAFLGTPLTLVGYGATTATTDDRGTRRSLGATAALLDPGWVFTEPGEDGWCFGDEGGAMLADGPDGIELVAVITGGVGGTGSCAGQVTFGARTDVMVGFLTRHGAITEPVTDTDAGDTDLVTDSDEGCGCATGALPVSIVPMLSSLLLALGRRRR